jgi:hypothetical protein
MKKFWLNLPEQIRRLALVIVILGILFLIIRPLLIPEDFGQYGHFRTSALNDIIAQKINFAGRDICTECHDEISVSKRNGFHRNLACETCHGPAADHVDAPDEIIPPAPRERGYCPLCHEYNSSRPTGFPQIRSAMHNPSSPCIECHDPHAPEPPETPKECAACHAEIENTKSLSHHVNVPCTYCHDVPEQHKTAPREHAAGKPKSRALCGTCHAVDADSPQNIPRIDLETHESRYVCWQCHYPHLPEAK